MTEAPNHVQAVICRDMCKPGLFWQFTILPFCRTPPPATDPCSLRSWNAISECIRRVTAALGAEAAEVFAFGRGAAVPGEEWTAAATDLLLLEGEPGPARSVVQRSTAAAFSSLEWWPGRYSASSSAIFVAPGSSSLHVALAEAFATRDSLRLVDYLFRVRFDQERLARTLDECALFVTAGANWAYAPSCHLFLPSRYRPDEVERICAAELGAAGVDVFGAVDATDTFRYLCTHNCLPPTARRLQ